MKRLLPIFLILFISTQVNGQKTRRVRGYVINKTSGLGIERALVSTHDKANTVLTDSEGLFRIKIPRKTDSLFFSKEGFSSTGKALKFNTLKIDVKLTRLVPDPNDLPRLKNSLSFLPLKLITGGLAFRYERFFKTKYSLGLYTDYYYRGREYFGTEEFKGIKVTPHFRYYTVRNKSFGVYAQGGIIISYFDFHKLYYNTYEMEYSYSTSPKFWTGGFIFSFGIEDIVGNSRNFIVDISVGLQYMPQTYPTTVTGPHGLTYTHNPGWWYAGGPGSLVEIKLAFGGIF
jgi:hypothetical protein